VWGVFGGGFLGGWGEGFGGGGGGGGWWNDGEHRL